MSTTILDNKTLRDLQPATGLWELYDPETAPCRFLAQSAPEARQWQAETRPALGEVLGFQALPSVPLAPERIEKVDKGDYVREKILLRTSPHSLMPVYMLIPKQGQRPLPLDIK